MAMDSLEITLDINDPETVARFDGMYVDFYLEDDMFELNGQFFTVDDQLYIEVQNGVMHMLEMAGKELRLVQIGQVFTAYRPDGQKFMMAINRVYYKIKDPTAETFKQYLEEKGVDEFYLLIETDDIAVKYNRDTKKWSITQNKINMIYLGDTDEYDTIEELCENNKDDLPGTWEGVIYEAYEEESDFTQPLV